LLFRITGQGNVQTASFTSTNTINSAVEIDDQNDTSQFLVNPGVIDSGNKIYVPFTDSDDQISVSNWTSADSPTIAADATIGLATAAFNGAASAPFVAACLVVDGTDVHLLYSDSTFDLQHNDDVDGGGAGSETELQTATVNRISVNKGTSDLLYLYDDADTTKFGSITLAATDIEWAGTLGMGQQEPVRERDEVVAY